MGRSGLSTRAGDDRNATEVALVRVGSARAHHAPHLGRPRVEVEVQRLGAEGAYRDVVELARHVPLGRVDMLVAALGE